MIPKIHLMHAPGFSEDRDKVVAWYLNSEFEVCLHSDPDHNGVLWNHATIVECMLSDTTDWSLVVQDDALPLAGWTDHLEQVQWYAQQPFVSLSHFSSYGDKLVKRGIPFGTGINCIWGQAVLYHHGVREPYAQLVRDFQEMDPVKYRKWDDGLIPVYNLMYGTKASFTSRALFEHQDWPSTMGHVPGRWRHAAATIANYPRFPSWAGVPRSAPGGPSVEAIQREAAQEITNFRRVRSLG